MYNWKDKRVVVTGGAGFLGSYVVEKLRERGCKRIFVPRSKECDLREKKNIVNMLKADKPDIVIHLAANVGGIGYNQTHPAELFYDNAIMGIQLMEQARKRHIKKLVVIGTDCAYPKFPPIPFNEDDIWNGYPEETNAPYGLAKRMLLAQAWAYRAQYGLNAIYLLPTNLYGPRDTFDPKRSHVVPALIKKVMDAKNTGLDTVFVWGTGKATREFLYAEDAAEGIVLATEKYDKPDPVNLGSGDQIKIKTLANWIMKLSNFSGRIVWDTSKPDGQLERLSDVSRAKKEFGFEAKTELRDGLKKTIDWYDLNN